MENLNIEQREQEQQEVNKLISLLPKVEQMPSNKGNDIPNQYIIRQTKDGQSYTLFQSYICGEKINNKVEVQR